MVEIQIGTLHSGIALFCEPQSPQFPTSRINRGVIAALQTFLQSRPSILWQDLDIEHKCFLTLLHFLLTLTLLGCCFHNIMSNLKSRFDLI